MKARPCVNKRRSAEKVRELRRGGAPGASADATSVALTGRHCARMAPARTMASAHLVVLLAVAVGVILLAVAVGGGVVLDVGLDVCDGTVARQHVKIARTAVVLALAVPVRLPGTCQLARSARRASSPPFGTHPKPPPPCACAARSWAAPPLWRVQAASVVRNAAARYETHRPWPPPSSPPCPLPRPGGAAAGRRRAWRCPASPGAAPPPARPARWRAWSASRRARR